MKGSFVTLGVRKDPFVTGPREHRQAPVTG